MEHNMKLTSWPFELIESWKKSIEIRLFDEKRSTINIWDTIIFTKLPKKDSQIKTSVIGLIRYKNFSDMFDNIDIFLFWWTDKKLLLQWVYQFYSKEKEEKYWVLWIHLKKTNYQNNSNLIIWKTWTKKTN